MPPPSRRLAVWSWSLYDLANTVFYLLVITIHGPDRMEELAGSESAIAWAFVPAMFVSALLAPAFGALIDRGGRARAATVAWTAVCVAATLLLGAPLGLALYALILGVALVAYELGCVSYNALLPAVADEANQGRVSGLGVSLGYLGNVFALLFIAAFRLEQSRAVFVVAAVGFALFTLPLAFAVPEPAARRPGPVDLRVALQALRDTGRTLLRGLRRPRVGLFLIGLFLVCDAINTVLLQVARYAENGAGLALSKEERSDFLLGLNVAAIVGGVAIGWLADRTSGRRATLLSVLLLGTGLAAAQFLPGTGVRMWAMSILGGAGVAGVWTASRRWLLQLAPKDEVGEAFGLYGFVLRASAVSLVPFTLLVDRTQSYSGSVLLLVGLLAAGGLVLVRVPVSRA